MVDKEVCYEVVQILMRLIESLEVHIHSKDPNYWIKNIDMMHFLWILFSFSNTYNYKLEIISGDTRGIWCTIIILLSPFYYKSHWLLNSNLPIFFMHVHISHYKVKRAKIMYWGKTSQKFSYHISNRICMFPRNLPAEDVAHTRYC